MENLLDPVDAYDCLAPVFAEISDRRRAYLDAIDRLIVSEIPRGSRSLLDVGAGDGVRALKIAKDAGIEELVLLDPSAEMRKNWPAGVPGWAIRAEEIPAETRTFDVITCLWNTLGHVSPAKARIAVLRRLRGALAAHGRIFIDVNHRYNIREYGSLRTLVRMFWDYLPNERKGDVIVRWEVDRKSYATKGHVFTDREFRRVAYAAGLKIVKRFVVDYCTGELHSSRFRGNLLYCLVKSPANLGDLPVG